MKEQGLAGELSGLRWVFASQWMSQSLRNRLVCWGFASVILLACWAGSIGSAGAQVVQLPSLQSFGMGTTVNVPDRGAALLGGISRGTDSSVSRGVPLASGIPGVGRVFGNRAISATRSVSTASVHVQIIDFEELDRQTLAEGARRREAREARQRASGVTVLDQDQQLRADRLNRYMGRSRDR